MHRFGIKNIDDVMKSLEGKEIDTDQHPTAYIGEFREEMWRQVEEKGADDVIRSKERAERSSWEEYEKEAFINHVVPLQFLFHIDNELNPDENGSIEVKVTYSRDKKHTKHFYRLLKDNRDRVRSYVEDILTYLNDKGEDDISFFDIFHGKRNEIFGEKLKVWGFGKEGRRTRFKSRPLREALMLGVLNLETLKGSDNTEKISKEELEWMKDYYTDEFYEEISQALKYNIDFLDAVSIIGFNDSTGAIWLYLTLEDVLATDKRIIKRFHATHPCMAILRFRFEEDTVVVEHMQPMFASTIAGEIDREERVLLTKFQNEYSTWVETLLYAMERFARERGKSRIIIVPVTSKLKEVSFDFASDEANTEDLEKILNNIYKKKPKKKLGYKKYKPTEGMKIGKYYGGRIKQLG